ncbi:MAG: hypothetical protein MSC31_08725 [Solirubrobacteraceae bacterium MAG38_C4-C5]|nr:hypothetical protein [Candidatus Siliceabacter maunaloa]
MTTADQQQAAIQALLERSGRDGVPLRRSFTQLRTRGGGRGPLAAFVTGRRRNAFDLYLLAHAAASAPPWDVALDAAVWARLLGISASSATTVLGRQWPWLEKQRLVEAQIHERNHKVVLLREDGSGQPYTHPGASTPTEGAEGDYFTLPHLYWHAGWYGQMDLATRVVLLIALSRPPGEFILPIEHAANWYGFSAESMRHGLKTLQLLGLLEHRTLTFPAPLSRLGYRTERRYRLSGPLASYYDRDAADAATDAPA